MNAGFLQRQARSVLLAALLRRGGLHDRLRDDASADGGRPAATPDDPLEGFNRAVYTVNDKLDRAVFKPLAQGYEKVLPDPVRVVRVERLRQHRRRAGRR